MPIINQLKARKTGKISVQGNKIKRCQPSYQIEPTKCDDYVQNESIELKFTTKSPVLQFPIASNVELKVETSPSIHVLSSDDDSDIASDSPTFIVSVDQSPPPSPPPSPPQSNTASHQRSSTDSLVDKRQSRKQAQPKKHYSQTPVIREIIRLQNSTHLLIPQLPFQRLVREVMQQYKIDFRIKSSALECLQEAAEHFSTQLFEDAYLCCLHRGRVTLNEKDLRIAALLSGHVDAGRK